MNRPILRAVNISRHFTIDNELRIDIIKNISLHVNAFEILAIMGESGAGKSTLLNILSTLDSPNNGSVLFQDRDLTSLDANEISEFRNKSISFVFQQHHLLSEFNVLDNIIMPCRIASVKYDAEYLDEILEMLSLKNRVTHQVKKLSGGEQQRVSVARALINKPQLIFCDEPSGNLDQKNSEFMFQFFKKMSQEQKATFIIVTHSQLIHHYADRVIFLKDGEIALN